ncbi:MAG TPA: aminoacyl-tRNA hydrolase [Candidatus Babeliales bacterium]|nr:aminoacyl-tRNA hydrolase [Candidatus Babeliales bacterium]
MEIPLNWDIKAIIGLGNPGKKYTYNRHNIGFLVADMLVDTIAGSWVEQSVMHTAEIRMGMKKIIVVKPQTFMNDSGRVVPLLRKQGIEIGQILVVHDELELPFGAVKTKMGGSAKGHNGLRSIIQAGGMEFMRLRCGIGRPQHREAVPDYVLQNFSEPKADVEQMIYDAVAMIEQLVGK